jgi:hypothetical protein
MGACFKTAKREQSDQGSQSSVALRSAIAWADTGTIYLDVGHDLPAWEISNDPNQRREYLLHVYRLLSS